MRSKSTMVYLHILNSSLLILQAKQANNSLYECHAWSIAVTDPVLATFKQ